MQNGELVLGGGGGGGGTRFWVVVGGGGGGGVEAPGFELWLGEGEEEVSRIGM